LKKISLLFIIIIGTIFVSGCDKEKELMKKIRVAEVTHSVFYAPWYVAIENGYFEDEGLEIDLVLTPGADKVGTSVLSNDVEIGLSGLEATMYVYENNAEDYLINFSALTKRDGQFLVGHCDLKDSFQLNDLIGKSVLVGRSGGMPAMVFNYGLYKNGLTDKNITLDTTVDFASLSGAYIAKEADFVNLFEPTALNIEKEGYGCVLSSVGLMSGELPYTVFYAKKSYIKENRDIIKSFIKAIDKGLNYVHENNSEDIAKSIINSFPDTDLNDLITIVDRYKQADSWWKDHYITEESYNNLIKLMEYNNALDKKIDYKIIVDNE